MRLSLRLNSPAIESGAMRSTRAKQEFSRRGLPGRDERCHHCLAHSHAWRRPEAVISWSPLPGCSRNTLTPTMAYLGVLAIALANGVVLFFGSFLAAGGDGGADGVYRVWHYGLAWIAVFTVAALSCCARKNATAGLSIAAATLPAGWAAGLIIIFVASGLGFRIG